MAIEETLNKIGLAMVDLIAWTVTSSIFIIYTLSLHLLVNPPISENYSLPQYILLVIISTVGLLSTAYLMNVIACEKYPTIKLRRITEQCSKEGT